MSRPSSRLPVASPAVLGVGARAALDVPPRRGSASCETTGACSVDGGCGCGPALDEETAREAGCTLDTSALPDREQAFRHLFARGLLRREAHASRAIWTFAWSRELEDEARALAAAESGCCSFFEFDIRRTGDELRWTTRVPAGRERALGMLDRMAAEAVPNA